MKRTDFEEFFAKSWNELQNEAWQVRKNNHQNSIAFAAPSSKHYDSEEYENNPNEFIALSVTGKHCKLQCEHCKGKMLRAMRSVVSPAQMVALGEKYKALGCRGVLISGGAELTGEVPLKPFFPAIKKLKQLGFKVIVHTGFLSRETARELRECQVDQVLIDVIGHESTLKEVYHLDKDPAEYETILKYCHELGLTVAPHIVIGLHYGQLKGELEALYQITKAQVPVIVLVVLNPLKGTPMAGTNGVEVEKIGKLIAIARIFNPGAKVSLGCALPAGLKKRQIEDLALQAGVNTISYPAMDTVAKAKELGLGTSFSSLCCSLL
jgi:uncharacterized radical SAM superfamily protein